MAQHSDKFIRKFSEGYYFMCLAKVFFLVIDYSSFAAAVFTTK